MLALRTRLLQCFWSGRGVSLALTTPLNRHILRIEDRKREKNDLKSVQLYVNAL